MTETIGMYGWLMLPELHCYLSLFCTRGKPTSGYSSILSELKHYVSYPIDATFFIPFVIVLVKSITYNYRLNPTAPSDEESKNDEATEVLPLKNTFRPALAAAYSTSTNHFENEAIAEQPTFYSYAQQLKS